MGGLKPRAEVFRNACKTLGTAPAETLMIGDKASKDGGALRAGLRFIHLVNSESKKASKSSQVKVSETKTESVPAEMTWNELLSNFCK